MKYIYFLLSFFQIISPELNAQSDSLLSLGTSITLQIDSIHSISPVILDSSISLISFKPSTNDLLSLLISPSNIDYKSLDLNLHFESHYNSKGAKQDLKQGKPLILFSGGFGGMPDFNSKADIDFQRKYQVKFYSQGCVRYGENENEEAYNQVVFQYLDQEYGKGWRDELRINAIGFKAPRTNVFAQKIIANLPSIKVLNQTSTKQISTTNQELETSVWWYIMPTSGFALLLALYFIKKRKN